MNPSDNVLKIVEQILVVIVAACLCYVVFFIMTRQQNVSMQAVTASVAVQEPNFEEALAHVFPGLSNNDAMGVEEGRDIFSSASRLPAAAVALSGNGLPDNYKVVGIIVGNPSEVVIEDNQTKQTYFIQQGQTQGGISLERVENGQAFLNYQGKEIAIKVKDAGANL